MFPPEETKDKPLEWREGSSASLRIEGFDLVDHVLFAMPDYGAAACCQNVLVPINIRPIRELNHEAIFDRRNNDGRLVDLAAASPNVPDNRERSERGVCKPAIQGI